MGIAAEKPTVRERIAAAVSDGLGIDQAAMLGSAQLPRDDGLVLTLGDNTELEVKARAQLVERDGRDLGLELAALLLRAKYAGDYRGIVQARYRLALRLRVRSKGYLRKRGRKDDITVAVASQSIVEWIADRCEPCKGTGLRGASMGGMDEFLRPCATCKDGDEPTGWIYYAARGVRPDGSSAPKAAALRTSDDPRTRMLYGCMLAAGMGAIRIQCPDCRGMRYRLERKRVRQRFGRLCLRCGGEGDAQPRHAERARAIGVRIETYQRHWQSWFDWSREHLSALDKTLVANLRCELGEGYTSRP